MKKNILISVIILLLLFIFFFIKFNKEEGTFEEVVFKKYEQESHFTYMEIFSNKKTKSTSDIKKIRSITSQLSNIKLKENYINKNSIEDSVLNIYLYNQITDEYLNMNITSQYIEIVYSIKSLKSNSKESRKKYNIINKNFNLNIIKKIYDSL
ncbi:MAG: hypothetical protein ACTHWZ_08565 [Peptoniphilaceae bacterium]